MENLKTLIAFVTALLLVACEKYSIEEEDSGSSSVVDGNLVVKVECVATKSGETEDDTESLPLAERFTRMSLAVYQDDVRVDYVNQTNTDKNFGTLSLDLEPGTYQFVVLAHSGQRSPTTTKLHKITFSNPLTDVFSYYGEAVISSETNTITAKLTRAVAKIQLNITDEIPTDVSFFSFICKGTSVSMDATTQTGISSSTKGNVEIEKKDGVKTYDIYTFVTGDDQKVNLDVTGYTGDKDVKGAKKFDSVPVSLRKVTSISTDFFDGVIDGPTDIVIDIDDSWDGTIEYDI